MADDLEKTEEPTPKKIADAKKEGNVPKSMDTSGFITLLVAVIAFIALTGWIFDRLEAVYRYYINFTGVSITPALLTDIVLYTIGQVLLMILPLAIPVAIAGMLAAWMQFGFIFTTKPLVPDLKKIDPIKGAKNLFSVKKLIESFKITFKVSAVFGVAFAVFLGFIKELVSVAHAPLAQQMVWLANRAMLLAGLMLVLLMILALIDLLFVRYNYFKELRMSKQEIKDEMKQLDGNPEVKAKIRQIQTQMARKRMLAEVPKADVVITNPTHFAVALQYKEGESRAPKVIAKGTDLIALKIREIAREHYIQIVENPPLARELYKRVEVEQEIPEQFYHAVAEVLAFVYKSKRGL
ncbi:MAG: flagellar biosynthesis protein FlhB [Hydrogenimonas sp.]|nr:MAG: flagellar biosynthesis protein FlhB [Hydrogenimonas sp.]